MSLVKLIAGTESKIVIGCPIGVDIIPFTKTIFNDISNKGLPVYVVSINAREYKGSGIDYNTFNSGRFDTGRVIYIFDNIRDFVMFADRSIIRKGKSNKFINIASYGVTQNVFNVYYEIFKDSVLLYGSFVDYNGKITYKMHVNELSMKQVKVIAETPGLNESHYRAIENVVYLNEDAFTVNPIKTEKAAKMYPVLENSPKLKDLIESVISARNQRHIIYVNYSEYYGSKIIELMLKPYKIHIYKMDEMKEFNNNPSKAGVLIITKNLKDYPLNVNQLHFFDGVSPDVYNNTIHRVYKYRNYITTKCVVNLIVNFYTSTSKFLRDFPIDTKFYRILSDYIADISNVWKYIKTKGRSITLKDKFLSIG